MRIISPSSLLPFRTIVVLGAAITALCAGGAGVTARAHKTAASHERGFSTADHAVTPDLAASAQVRERYGHLPLSFEANHGQSDSTVKFLSRGSGYSLFLTSNEAVLVLKQSEADENRKASRVARAAVSVSHRKSAVVRMTLVNANSHSQPAGHDALPGKSNYFIGNNPAKWHTNIPTYAKVKYEGVYPGVDLVYYGNQGRLEYDFVVAPGADPRLVTLAFEGAREIHIDARGELVLGVEGGEVRQHKPVVYQEVAGVKQDVTGRYVMKGKRQVGFRVDAYDPSRPLIIDPVLVYSTFLGGSDLEAGFGIAVDDAGSAYVTGQTSSTDYPTTSGAAQTTYAGSSDAFVTKLDATGSGLVYSTYLGGSGGEVGFGIAVDGAGSAYVSGLTGSTDFPTTAGVVQTTPAGNESAFVSKLNATGSGLVYSTYLGGSDNDFFDSGGRAIAVDGAGSVYVTGQTRSTEFPTTAGAAQMTHAGRTDAFVTKLNAAGSGLVYSTYLGGSGFEFVWGIAVDGAGSAYVTGSTASIDFPTTAGAVQTTNAGFVDAFVTKLDATGSGLVYSSYLGGSDSDLDFGGGIAVDGAGSAYVTGRTGSSDFPTTAGAAQPTYAGSIDAFVTKLDATGSGLVYSTYLGGTAADRASGIAVDGVGSAYVTGATASTDFPTTSGAAQTTFAGQFDAFVTKLDATGSGLVYSTYVGGNSSDPGTSIAVDGAGSAYVTGITLSTDFPTTSGAAQTTFAGMTDAFVAKIEFVAPLPTSKDQCKNGGWKTFGVFKNQGDCVSFVASKGKNPPSER
jgi:hypothetical protein